jgi:hypothetical protein
MVDFNTLSATQLVAFYNRHAHKPVNRFSDRKAAIRRCLELFNSLKTDEPVKVMKQKADENLPRNAMKTSLKLDRTICCADTSGVWKNAYQMWCANPDWMTSGQQDRLTAQLYAAAKRGEQLHLTINDRTFYLVNV